MNRKVLGGRRCVPRKSLVQPFKVLWTLVCLLISWEYSFPPSDLQGDTHASMPPKDRSAKLGLADFEAAL